MSPCRKVGACARLLATLAAPLVRVAVSLVSVEFLGELVDAPLTEAHVCSSMER